MAVRASVAHTLRQKAASGDAAFAQRRAQASRCAALRLLFRHRECPLVGIFATSRNRFMTSGLGAKGTSKRHPMRSQIDSSFWRGVDACAQTNWSVHVLQMQKEGAVVMLRQALVIEFLKHVPNRFHNWQPNV